MTLSSLLRLANVPDTVIKHIQRAEQIAPEVLAANGLLLSYEADLDLYDVIDGQQLTKSELSEHETLNKQLGKMRTKVPGKKYPVAACDIACDAYTPKIDAAYYLGLAMGFAVAKMMCREASGR